jgi:hypothetical protein
MMRGIRNVRQTRGPRRINQPTPRLSQAVEYWLPPAVDSAIMASPSGEHVLTISARRARKFGAA